MEKNKTKRFLLKSRPDVEYEGSVLVEKTYLVDKDSYVVLEFTSEINTATMKSKFYKATKALFAYEDIEADFDDWLQDIEQAKSDYSEKFNSLKLRFIKNHDGITWKIDEFKNCQLVIAEASCPNNVSLSIPYFLNDNIIIEITDMEEFEDMFLANEIK